jgi:ParB family chromosome partitioning protein
MPRALRAVPRATFEDLDAAIDARPPVDDRLVHSLPLVSIQPSPRNPRHDIGDVDELAESLRAHGLLQPVVVRRRGRGYELIAGHRRLEAARQLGWAEIAAVVRDETDNQAYILTLVENLQREDLQPKEEAAALEVLVRERGWSTRQVGEAIKRSHIYVSRRLRVFDDPALAPLVLQKGLAVSAEELLRAPDTEARKRLASEAAAENWTPADARRAVKQTKWNESFQQSTPSPHLASHIRALREELAGLEPGTLSERARRELVRLLEVGWALTSRQRVSSGSALEDNRCVPR